MQAIVERLKQGASYRTIAREFGISAPRVARIREYAQLERRKQPR